tara:strand:- start:733 stop:1362 length:630 start_codon:yes stop_codon:yes gene_type:complete
MNTNHPDLTIPAFNQPTAPPPQPEETNPPQYNNATTTTKQPIPYYHQATTQTPPEEPKIPDNQTMNLYECILYQIKTSLEQQKHIVSHWTNNNNLHEAFVWDNNRLFLGKIAILLTRNDSTNILPYTIDISIKTKHRNRTKNWSVSTSNATSGISYTYHLSLPLNHRDTLHFLCKDVYYIVTPTFLAKRRLTLWNLLDGSYFVRDTRYR